MSSKPLVVFTPSGKRGHFEKGTSILQIARQLGVDLDSVCGGRGICSKCQITPSYGEFTKHGVTVAADALSEWNKVEERYNKKLANFYPQKSLNTPSFVLEVDST